MKRILAAIVCVAVTMTAALAAESGYKVRYDGGSLTGTKVGNDLKLFIDGTDIRLMNGK